MKQSTLSVLFLLSSILARTAAAAVIQVPAEQPTIQQAIDAASAGDSIVVSPGTYFENINFHGKAVTVRSQRGAARTIIDGSNAGPVVTCNSGEGNDSAITGFTIQHGNASFGAGINILVASPLISRNIFRNNSQGAGGFGAAIGGNNCSSRIEGNTFVANTCDTQFLSGVVAFVNGSSPFIVNNVFADNPCRAINLTLPAGTSPIVAHNTIVGNSVGMRLALFGSVATHVYANNILVNNDVGLDVDGSDPIWTNNLVFGNGINYFGIDDLTGSNGNISVDPAFVNSRRFDFRLQSGSPAIDGGTLAVPGLPPRDFAGRPRVVDGDGNGVALPDMGAYEFNP